MEQALHELSQHWQALKAVLYFDTAQLATPEMVFRLILQVLLLLGSAFFSSSETALFSLSRLDLQRLRKVRIPQSESLHALLDQPGQAAAVPNLAVLGFQPQITRALERRRTRLSRHQ